MAVGVTLASPVAWEHHYGILFPVFAVLLAGSMGNRRRLVWVMVAYVLASNYVPVAKLLAPTVFNVALSHLFVSALIVMILLHTSGSRTFRSPAWPHLRLLQRR